MYKIFGESKKVEYKKIEEKKVAKPTKPTVATARIYLKTKLKS